MIEEIAVDLQIVRTGDVNRKMIPQQIDEALAHLCGATSWPLDTIGRRQRNELPLHGSDFLAAHITHDQRVVQAEHFAIDFIEGLSALVGDLRILAQAKELLANDVAHGGILPPAPTRQATRRLKAYSYAHARAHA